MAISVFDLFKIGIGPSSSHTVGPMRAARQFIARLEKDELLTQTASVRAEMFGSLGATGKGHGTDVAVLLGLQGEQPDLVDTDAVDGMLAAIRASKAIALLGKHTVPFVEGEHLILHKKKTLPYHPNGMIFEAFDAAGASLSKRAYYSVGGGFVVDEAAIDAGFTPPGVTELKHPFKSAAELLALCQRHGKSISQIMLENELAWRSEEQVRAELLKIWQVMQDCVKRGCEREGILPGGMKVKRRAADMHRKLLASPEAALRDPLTVMDWVNLYALAVNEENAGGGRVVTAPTNGAAGIIPAVMHYYARFVPGASDDGIVRFLLTAGAIGVLFKLNASISGAEVGCQGEVGSACSMAAGALAEVLGGTPEQVENAAEIGMEHNLGLTCDPVGGLVQVPCIERNAMASVKAINAARMALRGDGQHFVSLDRVIKTMRDTGMDMSTKYKETARGGLAINVIEVPVNIVEC
ncbi:MULTISPECIES: L-serine ammonia-lyase [Chromobacterium]|uniref:L-serine dehydratase n=2 Tax=Chromobacterium TaxID=535 RepID=A0A1W0CNF6_9NEIS|nr:MULTISPECIES: L-serine ammonia-lyase [Chromobacterium]AXT46178.1 L-serine ammonia-lyase [Chromobacterium rhizoryzae]MDH0339906.1 L-serine ammonia-lyase [Chromobacterium haemolyticum]OQS36256.1 L-serine ammonia-lyase [Chromobacterium haemolyticum]PTU70478.1 L-serine ammonia-lyase [Chromobacterium haemolyticum]QOD84505.1 L-serine ammonia-lyase [Chromobacterium haemolyticum]